MCIEHCGHQGYQHGQTTEWQPLVQMAQHL